MTMSNRGLRSGLPGAHAHLVEFYEHDSYLVATVCGALVPALQAGDAAVVVATAPHRRRFEDALAKVGIDLRAAIGDGRYQAFDARWLLGQLMGPGGPDPARFSTIVSDILARATAGGRSVRVFGEMVALLWDDGDAAGACELEDLWNDLAETAAFTLLCAYPMGAFDDHESEATFRHICDQHTDVIPTERVPGDGDPSNRTRVIAELQRQAVVLEAEVRRAQAHAELLSGLAYADPITGLPNRRAFDLDLAREWATARRTGQDSYVVVADLDQFKHVNDTRGHATGDLVLREFARALRTIARKSDVVARLGGDEFGALLSNGDEEAAVSFVTRLREILARRSSEELPILFSTGHASIRAAGSPSDALRRADMAMLAAKAGARRRRR